MQFSDAADRDIAEAELSGTSQQRRTAGKVLDRVVVEVVVGDQRHVGLDSRKGTQEPVVLGELPKGSIRTRTPWGEVHRKAQCP